MSELLFNNIRKAKHTFDITVDILDGDSDQYSFKIIDFGEFEYGNNNKEENVYYPPNTKLEFTVQGGTVTDSNVSNKYFELLRTLSLYGANVSILKDNAYYFEGYVDAGSIGSDYKEKSINFNIISDLTKLKETSPEDEKLGYTISISVNVFFYDLIRKIVNYALPGITNWEGEISDVCATTTLLDLAEDPWLPNFKQLGTSTSYLLGNGLIHESLFELLVSILSTFGLIIQIKDNTAYLQQRWDDTGSINNIELDSIIEGPDFEEMIPKLGLKAKVRAYGDPPYYIDHLRGAVGEGDDFEEMVINNPGGTYPDESGGYNVVRAYAPASEVGAENEGWVDTEDDEFFIKSDSGIAQYALWYVVANKVFKHIDRDREVFSFVLRGTNFINNQLCRLPNFPNLIFRPRKYKVNYSDNVTKIEFIKVVDQFSNPLGALDYDFNDDITLDMNLTTNKYNFNLL